MIVGESTGVSACTPVVVVQCFHRRLSPRLTSGVIFSDRGGCAGWCVDCASASPHVSLSPPRALLPAPHPARAASQRDPAHREPKSEEDGRREEEGRSGERSNALQLCAMYVLFLLQLAQTESNRSRRDGLERAVAVADADGSAHGSVARVVRADSSLPLHSPPLRSFHSIPPATAMINKLIRMVTQRGQQQLIQKLCESKADAREEVQLSSLPRYPI